MLFVDHGVLFILPASSGRAPEKMADQRRSCGEWRFEKNGTNIHYIYYHYNLLQLLLPLTITHTTTAAPAAAPPPLMLLLVMMTTT